MTTSNKPIDSIGYRRCCCCWFHQLFWFLSLRESYFELFFYLSQFRFLPWPLLHVLLLHVLLLMALLLILLILLLWALKRIEVLLLLLS